MSRYDGLIIPRSYSEYINKTDAATLLQALQQSGVMDAEPTADSNHPVKSGGVFNTVNSRIANLKYQATNLGQSTGYVKLSNVSLSLYHSNSYLIKFRLYAFLINITRLSNGYEYGARNLGIASSAVKAYYDNASSVYVSLPAFASGVSVITMDNEKNDFSISILASLPSGVTIAEIPIV